MIYACIRWWAIIFLRLYFRKTIVYGLENVPAKGPLIVASNHPSAFLEASLVATIMKRPVHFLVRGDMFHPRFRWLFNWTKQIPIYRKKDGITNLRKNASSFDLTYRKLAQGESVLIFPEAKTTLEKKMRPIQRGTAHLAFGTLPYLQPGQSLMIQPVGVNYTEPRIPGTDVVVRFGQPFVSRHGEREDRDAIEDFTETLTEALSPLIIQVEDAGLHVYDVMAAIYFRMIFDNHNTADAHFHLKEIASLSSEESIITTKSHDVHQKLMKERLNEAVYFPDLVVLNKMGLGIMMLLKVIWLIGGGWIWRVVKTMIFKKISTDTFQSPTSIGVFMVVMPLMTFIILILLWAFGWPWYYALFWMAFMLMGTLIRPPLALIWKLFAMQGHIKNNLKSDIIEIRSGLESRLFTKKTDVFT